MFSQEFRIPVCIRLFMGDLLSIKRLALHNLKRTGGELIISVLYGSYYNFCKFVNDAFSFLGDNLYDNLYKRFDLCIPWTQELLFYFYFILFYFLHPNIGYKCFFAIQIFFCFCLSPNLLNYYFFRASSLHCLRILNSEPRNKHEIISYN